MIISIFAVLLATTAFALEDGDPIFTPPHGSVLDLRGSLDENDSLVIQNFIDLGLEGMRDALAAADPADLARLRFRCADIFRRPNAFHDPQVRLCHLIEALRP